MSSSGRQAARINVLKAKLDTYIAEGHLPAAETDPGLRHMLGIERTDGGADYFNCDWLRENPRPDLV